MIYLDNDTEITMEFDYADVANLVVGHVLEVEKCPFDVEVNILLTDNDGIHSYNRECRGIDSPTDVLSFPNLYFDSEADFSIEDTELADYIDPENDMVILGDIIVSLDRVISQAEEYGHSKKREFAFLIAHSMLHLCGYDHMEPDEAALMEDKQNIILNDLGITREV